MITVQMCPTWFPVYKNTTALLSCIQEKAFSSRCSSQVNDILTGLRRTVTFTSAHQDTSFQKHFSAKCWAGSEPGLHSRLYLSFTLLPFSAAIHSYLTKPFINNNCNYFGKDRTVGNAVACLGQEEHVPEVSCLLTYHPFLWSPFQILWILL